MTIAISIIIHDAVQHKNSRQAYVLHVKMIIRLLLFILITELVTAQTPNPTIKLPYGVLQGSWKVSTKGRSYASFQGIPYARPPVGKYRFREPQQLKPWTGVWDATRPLPGCLRYDPYFLETIGSENCLFLNVYTPRLEPGAKLPVMVFIHGGAFMFGEGGPYSAANVMDWDMVVVTLNYRLGPLGFLSTGDDVVPGNNGLKDQSFALHWIKNNIMMFGGDPDSVTLTGSSAGGASVHYHYLSPLSRGTFARGISYSGSAFSSWTHSLNPAEKAKTLASIVGCPTGNSKELVECLKSRPAETIVNAQTGLLEWKIHLFTPFVPVVEAPGVSGAFLQQYPYHATKAGAMMNVPLILGVTSAEGLYPAAVFQRDPSTLPELESRWDELASYIFVYNDTLPLERRPEVAQSIRNYYFGGQPVSQETFPQLVQALGDRLFVVDVGKLAQLHASKSGQPTYVYRYDAPGSWSLSNVMAQNKVDYGVSHADDVLRIFKKYTDLETNDPVDAAMSEELINMVYSFSTTGTPKLNKEGPLWSPVKPEAMELNYLDILGPNKSELKSTTDFGKKTFWDKMGFNENENYNAFVKDEL